jgi:preprotein translocase subunit YajC
MTEAFFAAAIMAPLMLLFTAGIVYFIAIRSDEREMRLARERGELPPR